MHDDSSETVGVQGTAGRRCAFLTLEDRADFCIYDHLLVAPLAARGWVVDEVPWNRDENWAAYDAVVIRSTWDYQQHVDAFLATLQRIERQTQLFNSAAICRWNIDKAYLRELGAAGIPIVPTAWLPALSEGAIGEGGRTFACEKLIAKPRVGANADDTFVLDSLDRASWEAALDVFRATPLMLQPFIEGIRSQGEYSLFYFGGHYSHAIHKKPAPGDFRVQEEHGGIIRPADAPAAMRSIAGRCLAQLDAVLLYARVDLVALADGTVVVMELELIEPSLYFDQCPAATERFAETLNRMWHAAAAGPGGPPGG